MTTENSLKRPTNNSQESPPKRQKATESSSDDSGMGFSLVEPSPTLQPLPTPVLLLAAAQEANSKLQALQPRLTVLSSSASLEKSKAHADAYTESIRLDAFIIVALRSVINSGQNSTGMSVGIGGGRLELRARCQLAEILIRNFAASSDGISSTLGRSGMAEVEDVIAKGLLAASKHESFADYKYRLVSLSAEHSLLNGNAKFAKSTIKRSIAEILSLPTLLHPAWLYQFHLTLASIGTDEDDYPATLSSLREVESLAVKRGDAEMIWASRVSLARTALGEREFRLAGSLIESIAEMMGFDAIPTEAEETKPEIKSESSAMDMGRRDLGYLGRQMRIQFIVMYCLYHAQHGKVKLSKDKLKIAHGLLDQKVAEEGEDGGWVKIPIRAAENANKYSSPIKGLSSSSADKLESESGAMESVTIMTSPKSLMYGFAFLVSVAIHRDPFGTKPRSKLFATEGLKIVDAKLAGESECVPSHLPPSHLSAAKKTIAKLKIDLHLYASELETMRSSYASSQSHLLSALSTARSYPSLWEIFRFRLTLGMGCLAQAQMRNEEAVRFFEVVVELGKGSKRGEDELVLLAKMSILIIRISEGAKVRVVDSGASVGMARVVSLGGGGSSVHSTPTSHLSSTPSHSTPTQTSTQLASLNALAKELIQTTSNSSCPSLRIVGEFVAALTKGEIIKAKQHLSNALNLANTGLANHSKAIMLALLAGLFIHTRNDQALKMLTAAFTILRGMGSKNEDEADKDNIVGNSRLGSWVGEKLLEIYVRENSTAKAKRQESYNAAHRRVLERETAAAMKFSFSSSSAS